MLPTIVLTLGLIAQDPATVTTDAPTATPIKQWVAMTNYPGYEGYGIINQNGWLIPDEIRLVAATQTATQTATQPTVDPTGMVSILNGIRAQHGLSAVLYDPNASAAAAVNNSHQAAKGLGHHYTGGYAQNAAMGYDIWNMWMASPAHQALILDPNLRSAGGATNGQWSTLNATGHYGGAGLMLASRGQQQYATGAVAGRPQFRLLGGFFSRR